ncbi:MAG: methionyl-tRNA formyltransferase [Bacteroidota bacterium]|nr:methionyl-tRNA formyltransferase [Bacteroidota bacterium]
MKIIFFGTPNFAAQNLEYLINKGFEIVATITPPDSKTGRGKQLKACAVKEVALLNNIPVLQPKKLKSDKFISLLKDFKADLFVVVAFRMLPEMVWNIPKKGTINLHASFLPKYRGAAPINRVLINGEKDTGISTFFINHNIDSGEIIQQEKIHLTNQTTAAQLHNTLINRGNNLLKSSINAIKNKSETRTPQVSNTDMKDAPKLTKELLKIDWSKSAIQIHNLVRGLSPFLDEKTMLKDVAICPSAWFFLEEKDNHKKRVKLHLSEVVKSKSEKLLEIQTDNKNYLHINTKKDAISILNLQVEGKKPMTIQQFLQGNKITKNHKLI